MERDELCDPGSSRLEHHSRLVCCILWILQAVGSDCVYVSVTSIHLAVAYVVLVPEVVQVAVYCTKGPSAFTDVTYDASALSS